MGVQIPPSTLVRLRDVAKTVGPLDIDIRYQRVKDANGEAVGRVETLFIDDSTDRVRFFEVVSGGFWGIGKDRLLIPVEMIDLIGAGEVWLTGSPSSTSQELAYDPEIVPDPGLHPSSYDHHGLDPRWDNCGAPPRDTPRTKRRDKGNRP